MKTKTMFQLVVLLVIAVALLFFPAPAEAVGPTGDTPWVKITAPNSLDGYTGKYADVVITIKFCDGNTENEVRSSAGTHVTFGLSYKGKIIKFYSATFTRPYYGGSDFETISGCSGECGCETKPKKVSTCGGFSIGSRVPRSPAVPVSFKGPGNITSANIYFKNLKYSLPLWLHRYDGGRWYGYLNTMYLPLGKHHGRVTTYVDGVRGGGCASGGFKVVDE